MFGERGNSLEGFHGGTRPRAAAQSIELSISRLAGSSDKAARPLPRLPFVVPRVLDQHVRPSFARTILNRFGDRPSERSETPMENFPLLSTLRQDFPFFRIMRN